MQFHRNEFLLQRIRPQCVDILDENNIQHTLSVRRSTAQLDWNRESIVADIVSGNGAIHQCLCT